MSEATKKYEFRELCSKDIFPMFKIINKIGFNEFKECFQSDEVKKLSAKAGKKEDAAISSIGMAIVFDIAGIIIGNIGNCEKDIYTMLASVSNLDAKEIEKLSMGEFAEMIIDFVKKPEFMDFFKVVSKLFN